MKEPSRGLIRRDWWDDLVTEGKGSPDIEPERIMLRVVAYDITHPRRLVRVANVCKDFGTRVQKSVFECWLDQPRFEALVARLESTIDDDNDQVVIYTLQADSVERRVVLGRCGCVTEPPPGVLIL